MKTHRNRFAAKQRFLGKKSSRTRAFKRLSIASVERLEMRTMLTGSALQNPLDRWDVNNDAHVTAADALTIINQLMAGGPQTTSSSAAPTLSALAMSATALSTSTITSSAATSTAQAFTDVNGDGHVTAADVLSVINQLSAPNPNAILEYRLEVEDLNGNPLANNTIVVGQDFQLAAFAHDLRTPTAVHPGVFAGFMNVAYDALATIPAGTVVAHNPLQIHGASVTGFYTLTSAGDLSTPGQILRAGGADQHQLAQDNPAEQPLWTVHMRAAAAGVENFTSSFDTSSLPPAQGGTSSGDDSLLYGIDPPILAAQIQFDTAQLTITPSTTVSISPATISLSEAVSVGTPFLFTVSLSGPALTQNATVAFSTGGGSAVAGTDYQAASGTLTFTVGGPTTQTIAVTGIDDQLSEADETFSVTLSAPTNVGLGATTSAAATILDTDDPLPTVSISSSVSQNEGNAGTTSFLFTVNLSTPSGQQTTVNFATQDVNAVSTAGAHQDYQATSGILTFAVGEIQKVITATVLGDTTVESDETFNVVLSNPSHLTLGTATGVGTILNDDFPVISVTDVSQLEGGDATTAPFVFTVSLSQSSPSQVTVAYTSADGDSADAVNNATLANNDYQSTSGILTFAPNSTTPQLVTVLVNGDTVNERNENFRVLFSSPANAVFANSSASLTATGTIVNDDGPRVTITPPATIIAPHTGTTDAVFTVNLLAPSAIDVVVTYTTQDGTGPNGATVADGDYVPQTSGTVTIAANATSQDITVPINAEPNFEPDEQFSVNLTGVLNGTATIQQSTAAATISSDITPPTVSFSASAVTVSQSGAATTALFTVNLSGPVAAPVQVAFQTANDTATTGANDYTATSGTLTFAPGVTQQVITVHVLGDPLNDQDEDFKVNLTSVTTLPQLASPIVATGVIHNTNSPPNLTISNVSHTQPLSGTISYVFTVTLSHAAGEQVVVDYETGDATAKLADGDYAANSGTLTFNPGGSLTQLITVVVNGSAVNEADETFNVNLTTTTPAAVNITQAQGVGTLLNNAPPPTVSISNVSQNEGNPDLVNNPSGTTPFVFTVSLSAASGQDITVAYTTLDGTASTAGSDFTGQAGTLTFTAGTTTQFITVAVNVDTLNEADETFKVNLTSATHATISSTQGSGTGTILNDDPPPTVSIGDVTHMQGDSGTQSFVFQVTLSTLSGQTVTVAYATADGTSTTVANATVAAHDYLPTSGLLTFNAGVTTQTVTVAVVGDLFKDPDEQFSVNLTNPGNVTLQKAQGVGLIQSNPNHTLDFTPSDISGKVLVDSGAGQLPLSGIKITLTGTPSSPAAPNSPTLPITVFTQADGSYDFNNLLPGNYQITYPQQAHHASASLTMPTVLHGDVTTSATTVVLNTTIAFPGGVNATGTNLMVPKVDPASYSTFDLWSLFHPSTTQASAAAQTVATSAQSLAATSAAGLFTQSGTTLTVNGTSGDDTFEFTAGALDTVKINGVTRTFDPAAVTRIIFDGGAGKNSATLTGSTGDDVASLGLGSGTLTGSNFSVSVNNVSSLTVNGGGGHDTATLQDSALTDHLQAAGDGATLSNDLGLVTSIMAFSQVQAKSTNGGTDTAHVDAIDFALQEQGNWLAV